ncbi:VWA domain-containing protein [Halobacterium salinarum]|uniref:ATP-dependent cobaltochelatase subunit ChlID n=4 Tax=Halobacterium salinarum TaxID=2242 RepID=Q9HPM3_HALSA|nr:VWA domain-containing protein [Halobacterium salinarum]AAG19844.1 protoporphyrin IX magnesium chelatase [Halobacterium salinarum NRC-1]MBB6088851.1 magnesium chelatase subunit D [Halobacterium salinarum]MDL0119467.1 VWA domain-containing protein [Halobacterium salinarum]UEB91201.1 VWA domain-containing protein [Halobacterium salinarum NRC-34001]CAP14131.1 ATP-dependent cobaltochelatase subunit ChlID [Halobacterium salinarum R1]
MVDLGRSKKLSPDRRAGAPFPAVVGQDDLKTGLLAVAANASLDGLLVTGEKGTAKSTTARALADLLPDQRAVADCPYGCPPEDPTRQCADCRDRTDPPVESRPVPFVTLPLGASRDRVVGSLSVTDALAGDAEFSPGLLAAANRGILYVDEVNLLDDHLVDVLLDAAASGVNRVERDGVSVTHPAEFTLVGTMNPEEGDLRPQFRDRFALRVAVAGSEEIADRVEIMDRALAGFDGDYAADTAAVRDRLVTARDLLPDVDLPESLAREIAELCRDAGVDGHRADVATARAARTLAALDGRPTVTEADIERAAGFALPHRLQSRPFEDAPDPEDVVDDHFDDDGDQSDEEGDAETSDEAGGDDPEPTDNAEADAEPDGDTGGAEAPTGGPDDSQSEGSQAPADSEAGDDPTDGERGDDEDTEDAAPLVPGQPRGDTVEPGTGVAPDADAPDAERATGDSGRASATPSPDARGARVRTERATPADDVDAAASVRAAAARGSDAVESRDLRQSINAGSASALVVFAVDASASMRGPMRAAKGVALDLLRDAYQHRDEIAVVAFAGDDADVLVPPTDSVALAARHLKDLPTGDRTPLPAGLRAADDVLARADPDASVVVVVTDGQANATDTPTAATRTAASALAERGAHVVVVDAGDNARGLTSDIVDAADGERVPLDALSADRVEHAVGQARK